ncbi:MAG: TIGR03936 family radical SAM-associated protein [Christensenellales bacterium]
MKMLVVFSKRGRLKFIGHLDVMRAMQRALRRSGLPVKYSQGFNPHILLSFAAPLSVGVEGLREVMEVPLALPLSPEAFTEAFDLALPPLMRCQGARLVEDTQPAPMALCAMASYSFHLQEDAGKLLAALPSFLLQPAIQAERKSKKGWYPSISGRSSSMPSPGKTASTRCWRWQRPAPANRRPLSAPWPPSQASRPRAAISSARPS